MRLHAAIANKLGVLIPDLVWDCIYEYMHAMCMFELNDEYTRTFWCDEQRSWFVRYIPNDFVYNYRELVNDGHCDECIYTRGSRMHGMAVVGLLPARYRYSIGSYAHAR